MANVLVMTDTVAGIPKNLADEYGINVVPAAHILFENKIYIDGETITPADAYKLLQKNPDKFATTAIQPAYLLERYKALDGKAKDILFITLSNALSAVYQTATIAKDLFEAEKHSTNIRILNSRAVASKQGMIVLQAAKAAAQGMSLDQVVAVAEQTRQRTGTLMLLNTLRYAYRTGRISKTSARIAALLNIKPINRISDEGTVDFVDKVRNREAGLKKIFELIREEAKTEELHFWVMHAAAPEFAQSISEQLSQQFKCLSMIISEYSPVMGYGAGPGAISIGFHPELNLIE